MSDALKKLKRLEPLARVRQVQLDQESLILAAIRMEKNIVEVELKRHQEEYLRGVGMLNEARNSLDRNCLEPLEKGLDKVKNKWHITLRKLQVVIQKEKAQVAQTLLAQKNMKTMEILQENYFAKDLEIKKMTDTKLMDDLGNKRFLKNSSHSSRG